VLKACELITINAYVELLHVPIFVFFNEETIGHLFDLSDYIPTCDLKIECVFGHGAKRIKTQKTYNFIS
jgi:hypothetical protein